MFFYFSNHAGKFHALHTGQKISFKALEMFTPDSGYLRTAQINISDKSKNWCIFWKNEKHH